MRERNRRIIARGTVTLLLICLLGLYFYAYGLQVWNTPKPIEVSEAESTMTGTLRPGLFAGEYRDIRFSKAGFRAMRVKQSTPESTSIAEDLSIFAAGREMFSSSLVITDSQKLSLYVEKGTGHSGFSDYALQITTRPITDALDDFSFSNSPVLIYWERVEEGRWKAKLPANPNVLRPVSITLNPMLAIFPEKWPHDLVASISVKGTSFSGPVCLDRSLDREGIFNTAVFSDRRLRSYSDRSRFEEDSQRITWKSLSMPLELEMEAKLDISPSVCGRSFETWTMLSNTEQKRIDSFRTIAFVSQGELPDPPLRYKSKK